MTRHVDHTIRWKQPIRAVTVALAAILLLAGFTGPAGAQGSGQYLLQCFCPLEWTDSWDGNGVFDARQSLDMVALANDPVVLLMREIPKSAGTLDSLADERTASLEGSGAVDGLDVVVIDETDDFLLIGRTWEHRDGGTMVSVQYVQVWETNFLLSIEYVAPDAEFVAQWDSLSDVLLVGRPILGEFDADDLYDEIARPSGWPKRGSN